MSPVQPISPVAQATSALKSLATSWSSSTSCRPWSLEWDEQPSSGQCACSIPILAYGQVNATKGDGNASTPSQGMPSTYDTDSEPHALHAPTPQRRTAAPPTKPHRLVRSA